VGRERDYYSSSGVQVKFSWNYISIPYMFLWHEYSLSTRQSYVWLLKSCR